VEEGPKIDATQPKLEAIRRNQVPKGRKEKHKGIVDRLLQELDRLPRGDTLRVPLASLPAQKANIRSALNRAGHKIGLNVATSSDAENLYLWKTNGET